MVLWIGSSPYYPFCRWRVEESKVEFRRLKEKTSISSTKLYVCDDVYWGSSAYVRIIIQKRTGLQNLGFVSLLSKINRLDIKQRKDFKNEAMFG